MRDFATLQPGDEIAHFSFSVGAAEVRAYLDATGERSPLWETHVPPLAVGALSLAGLMERIEDLSGILHTGQHFELHRAVAIDEPVTTRFTVAARSRRRGVVMTAIASELSCDGEVVARGRTTLLSDRESEAGA